MNTRENRIKHMKSTRNIIIILARVIMILGFIVVVLLILLLFLFPLKEKVPYFVEFKTSQENFVVVRKANKELLSNTALIERELKGYVLARETINKIDEIRKWRDIVRVKSSKDVYNSFYKDSEAKIALWNTKGFSREAQIKSISHILSDISSNQFISIVEYSLIDRYENQSPSTLNFKATIKYEFNDQKISTKDLTLNPLGTYVIAYQISEIKE
jgi:type IV secretory pathway component VirB8